MYRQLFVRHLGEAARRSRPLVVPRRNNTALAASLRQNTVQHRRHIPSCFLGSAPTTTHTTILLHTRFFGNDSVNETLSNNNNQGEQLYQEYLEIQNQIESFLQEQEREKSQAMFEAWQRTAEPGGGGGGGGRAATNKKRRGVAVVKTLAKQTRKESNQADRPEKKLQQQGQRLLQEAALTWGHGQALVQLGNQTLTTAANDLTKANDLIDKTLDLYRLGGQAGSKEGWFNHGHLLWTGFPDQTHEELPDQQDVILPPNQKKSIESFEKAIELGDVDAMYFVGSYLLSMVESDETVDPGDARMSNVAKGLNLVEKAAAGGNGGALYYLSLFHLGGHVGLEVPPCSNEEFRRRLDVAVEAENEDALFFRGHSFYNGANGYPRDHVKALQDFLRAADASHADAAVSAGAMLHAGDHVPRDQKKAFELYQLAGELGSLEGWRNVAACYATGEGVAKSLEMAKYITKTMRLSEAPPGEDAGR